MKRMDSMAAWPAAWWPAPQPSSSTTGMKPRSVAWRQVGSMPISVAMPTMASALIPQSWSAKARGVPSKADMASLSKTASSGRGASSGMMAQAGESRRNQGRTASGSSVRCQAIAVRSCVVPIQDLGIERWRVKATRIPAPRAASSARPARSTIRAPSRTCPAMPACMS